MFFVLFCFTRRPDRPGFHHLAVVSAAHAFRKHLIHRRECDSAGSESVHRPGSARGPQPVLALRHGEGTAAGGTAFPTSVLALFFLFLDNFLAFCSPRHAQRTENVL